MTGNRNKENQEMGKREKKKKNKSNARDAIAFRAQRRKVWNIRRKMIWKDEKNERQQTAKNLNGIWSKICK